MGVRAARPGGAAEARRRGVPPGGATVAPDLAGSLQVSLGDSLATGAWPGLPRPWQSDALGVRLAGVPAAWFDHPAGGYPARVSRRLGTVLRPAGASVGTAGIYWRGGPTPLLRQALRGDPRLVTVTIGANDVLAFMAASGRHRLAMRWAGLLWRLPVGRSAMRRRMDTVVRDSAMEATGTRLASLLRYLTAPGRVVVVTTYPVGDGSDELRDSFVGPLNAQIRRAARVGGARLVDLEPLFAGHDRTTGRRDRWISRIDGMHPVARGHARIADAVVAAVLDPPGV